MPEHAEPLRVVPAPRQGGRVPPQNLDAERAILGGILLSPETLDEVAEVVKPGDFYREAHRKVYEAMLALDADGEKPDRVAVKARLAERGVLASVGEDLVDDLDRSVPAAANLAYYARIVRDAALLRRAIELAHAVMAEAYDRPGNASDFVAGFEQRVMRLAEAEDGGAGAFATMGQIVMDAMKAIEERAARAAESLDAGVDGIRTGIEDLDLVTGGFRAGQVVVLGAPPKNGKTSFMWQIATGAASVPAWGVGVLSLEMRKPEIGELLISQEGRIDSQRLQSGRLVESDWAKAVNAIGKLGHHGAGVLVDDAFTLGIEAVAAKARRMKRQLAASGRKLVLLVLDYLQLVARHGDRREQLVAEVSRGCKQLAVDLDCVVLVASSLNRDRVKRPDQRPAVSDLRDSGAIEADADKILLLHRAELYEDKPELKGIVEIIVGAQRRGPAPKTIKAAFLAPYTRFENLVEERPPQQMDWTEQQRPEER